MDSIQMTDIYGVACDVHRVRTFRDGRELGAGYDLSEPSTWFVYDRDSNTAKWHKHCGPYSTFDDARWWIEQIREVAESAASTPRAAHGFGTRHAARLRRQRNFMISPTTVDADVPLSVGPGFFHEAMPLAQLQPSPLNPRKRFTGIEELAQNIREIGLLQPLVARPVGDHYEIVAGARRYCAATLAGLTTVPCSVRHLTDAQALEIMVIENNQREDVNALEEADGFARLLQAGYKVDRLAERIGRSRKYVYDRVKLLQLVPDAQTLVLDGRITAGHAILLARLTPEDQARAIDPDAQGLFAFDNFGIDDRTQLTATKDPYANAHPLSVREFEGWIDEHIRLDLAEPVDADLFPEVAVAQEQADRVVSITLDSWVSPESGGSRGAGDTILGSREWKPADDPTCGRSVLGVVVIGPRRGTAFRVCVDRACAIHWETRDRTAHETDDGIGDVDPETFEDDEPASVNPAAHAALTKERAQLAKDEAERHRFQQAGPALRAAFLDRVTGLKESALVAFVLAYGNATRSPGDLPAPKTALDVVRRLVWEDVVLPELQSTWRAPTEVPKLAKALGVDLKPLLKTKPVQTSAQPARPPHRSFPKPTKKASAKKKR